MRGRFWFILLTLVWLVLPEDSARALIQAEQAACIHGVLGSEVTHGADTVSNTGVLSIGRDVASGCASGEFLIDDLRIYAGAIAQQGEALSGLNCRYTYGLDLISRTRVEGGTPETWYYGYDGQGSVRTLISASSGTITDSYDYDAYGMLLSSSWGSTPNNYRYSGEQWDQDLGAYYLRARYYSPQIGRFWTRDTYEGNSQDPLSLHKYLYAADNPVNLIDPSGHMNMASFTVTMSTWGSMIMYMAYRAAPVLNRATIIAFEATTGNTVMIGGSGAVVALKQGTKMGGVAWSTWQYVGNLLKGSGKRIGTYDELAAGIKGNGIGEAANHLNQAAAFSRVPHGEGVSIVMGGPTSKAATSHNLFHQTLEDFWNLFRTGNRRGTVPTNAEYDEVLQKALENAGHAADEASELVKLAREARKSYGYFDGQGGLPPEIPGRMPLPR